MSRSEMRITQEQREAWKEVTAKSPFNLWLDMSVTTNGVLNLRSLYDVARNFGIECAELYHHLNPCHQRMIISNMLRKLVPESLFTSPFRSPPKQQKDAVRPDYICNASVRELLLMQAEVLEAVRELRQGERHF